MIRRILLVEEAELDHLVEKAPAILVARIHFEERDLRPRDAFRHQPSILRILQARRDREQLAIGGGHQARGVGHLLGRHLDHLRQLALRREVEIGREGAVGEASRQLAAVRPNDVVMPAHGCSSYLKKRPVEGSSR